MTVKENASRIAKIEKQLNCSHNQICITIDENGFIWARGFCVECGKKFRRPFEKYAISKKQRKKLYQLFTQE